MKQSVLGFYLILLLLMVQLYAQQPAESDFGVTWKGFVKTDMFFDSRQVITAREGHLLLYPADKVLDDQGRDINEGLNFNILSIQTRLRANITAPDVLAAKVSGAIEAAFFGHSNADINGFRLRHAYLTLDWSKYKVLIGQYWHPLFRAKVFPGVVSFNTGIPIQPFSRNPQIRFTYESKHISSEITFYSQRDFSSTGPNGVSSDYLRNAGIPGLNLNFALHNGKSIVGIGMDYKSIKPRLSYNGLKSEETVKGVSFFSYLKNKSKLGTAKAYVIYGQNLYDLLMLGGYVEEIENSSLVKYFPVKVFSSWVDFQRGKKIQTGFFIGYSENLGSTDEFNGGIYSRGSNIKSIFRISPRLVFNWNRFRYGLELEITSAQYGIPDAAAKVTNTYAVTNVRLINRFYLFF